MKNADAKPSGDFLGRSELYDKESKEIDVSFLKLYDRLADETIKNIVSMKGDIWIC